MRFPYVLRDDIAQTIDLHTLAPIAKSKGPLKEKSAKLADLRKSTAVPIHTPEFWRRTA